MKRHRTNMVSKSFQCQAYICTCIISTFLICLSFSDPRISQAGLFCNASSTSSRVSTSNFSNLIPTFVKEMEAISQLMTSHLYATHHLNITPSLSIFTLAQCHLDLSQTDCLLCFAASRTKLPRCLPSLSAMIFLDGCFLRYDNHNFFKESVSSSKDSVECGGDDVERLTLEAFGKSVEFAVGNVTRKALESGRLFGVAATDDVEVFALGQCWESVGRDGCRECLVKAAMAVRKCVPKNEGRALNVGCYLRYSTQKFYNDGGDIEQAHGFHGLGIIIAIALATAAFLILSLFTAYTSYIRLLKSKEESRNLGKVSFDFNKSNLKFKYEALEKATDYFNPSKKLGQGGAGSVYMGTFSNGQTVAVKRLIFNTRQWVDEFFNEVNVIGGVQHKNLVKLLGCSIEGPESLLVYEYVPNKSLDHFLFDKSKTRTLNWKQRFDIIVGTAEGLAHLHGSSQTRIIHRDIKSSNVLLDENLNPKIADFGLVRCFGTDNTHISTGIAGTMGYMAPEYLIHGQLTEKADVYSFGVLVLEIVSGRRCNVFREDSRSLLQTVWQYYRSGKLVESVDPILGGDFPAHETTSVLQIGLLCTQASATSRPSMDQVVWMLTNNEREIPEPNQPPFMNANVLDLDSSKRSYSTSFLSNAAIKVEASTSSQSSSMHSSDRQ